MAYKVANINDLFRVKSDGAIEFGTSGAGTATYVLTSAGPNATPTWTEPTTGTVTGSGLENRVARWTADGSDIGNGPITFSSSAATANSTFGGNGLFTGTLTVQDRTSTASQALVYIDGKRTNGTDGVFGELVFLNNGDSVATVAAFRDTADNKGSLVFQTQNGTAGFGTRLTIAADGNATFGNNIYGNSSNTTEIGAYNSSVSPAINAAIKRIRMAQGGEIHFGDTTTAAPLGITEGNWDSFGDSDFLSIYGRSSIKLYSGATASAGTLRLTLNTSSNFEGEVNATGNITTDGIFKVDSAPDNNILEVDQSGRKMALKTSFASNTTGSFWAFKTSTGATDGAMTDALVLKPLLATFAGNVDLKSDAGGAARFLRIWNEGTVEASDDALITWQTQASRTYSMGINRESGSLTITNQDASVRSGELFTIASPTGNAKLSGNLGFPNSNLSSTAPPTNFGVYNSEIRLIETPNGGLKQCRVITDNYGEWILVGRFAASAMNSIANGNSWSSESGLDTGTAQNLTTKFSADFGDSFPTEVRIMGATDFTKWRDTRTVDFIYGVPEGRQWKYFFSGGAANGMTSVGPNHSGNNKFGWNINGSYDGFGRWVNPAQTSVGMSDANVTNPSAAYTTATTNAFNWDGADDAKITVSATRTNSGQDSFVTSGFGNDDNIYGFFDEYPNEVTNMQGGADFSSAAWVLIKLPNASSGGASNDYWSETGTDIYNTNSGDVGIGTSSPGALLQVGETPTASSQQGARIYGYDGALNLYTKRAESPFNAALYLYNNPVGEPGPGTGILFRARTSTTDGQVQATVYSNWTTSTHSSRTAKLVFQTCNAGTVSDKMAIQGNGNVGIGLTTAPDGKLQVQASSTSWMGYFYNTNTGGPGVHVESNSGLNSVQVFRVSANVDGNQTVLAALADGRVGIGKVGARASLEIFRRAGISGIPQLIISTGEGSSRDYSLGTDVKAAGDLAILDGVTSTAANVRMRFVDGGTLIGFRDNNTTELGTYSTGAIKRIRMCQGGEIHFGDTAVTSPLGITEGTWDSFGDSDFLSIYARNKLEIYTYPNGGTISASIGRSDGSSYILGNVGIGDTVPTSLSVNTSSLSVNSTRTDLSGALFQKSNGVLKFQQYWSTAGIIADVSAGDYFWKLANVNKMGLDTGTGALTVVGDIVAYGSPSDKRLKENIKPIESALEKVSKLQGVTFDWKESDSILDIKEDIGFIAQDVQKVIPELVRENDNGMLSMRHQGIAPILLEAIKELKAEIEELKKCKCDCKR